MAELLRPGKAGSNTAADHVVVFDAALAQLPEPLRRPDEHGRVPVLVRTDAAGATKVGVRRAPGRGRVEFSLGASLGHFDIHTALAQLPAQAWTPAYQARKPRAAEHGVQIEPRDGAWVAEASGLVDLSSWPAGTRLILRKERPHPGAQLRITDAEGLRVTGFLTNTAPGGPARQLADLELHHHRRHARVEDRPQTPRTAGFATCPTTTPPRTRSGWPSPRWPPSCSPRPHASRCPPRRQNWEKTFNTQINKIRYVIEQITDYWRPLATFTTKSQPSWDYISIAPRE